MSMPAAPLQRRLIASAIILDDAGNILLGRKAPGVQPYPDTWRIPGGGIEPGELCTTALCREIREETGIEVSDIRAVRFSEDSGLRANGELVHYVFLDYMVQYAAGIALPGDDLVELCWISREALQHLASIARLSPPSIDLFRYLNWISPQ